MPLDAEAAPAVSVLIGTHNHARYLDRTMQSVLTQTFIDLEIIVIDDGSTDDTAERLARWQQRDRRVVVESKPQGGLSSALNRGLSRVRGEFTARLDSDDIALPDRLAKQVAYLRSHADVGMLGGCMTLMAADERKLRSAHYLLEPAAIRSAMYRASAIASPTSMIRTALARRIGGWRSAFDYAEDYDFALRMLEVSDIVNLPDVVTYYRVHAAQVTSAYAVLQRGRAEAARISARYRLAGKPDPFADLPQVTAQDIGAIAIDDGERASLRNAFAPPVD